MGRLRQQQACGSQAEFVDASDRHGINTTMQEFESDMLKDARNQAEEKEVREGAQLQKPSHPLSSFCIVAANDNQGDFGSIAHA
jgi:hypothetical protein